jgi:hypothetical protein
VEVTLGEHRFDVVDYDAGFDVLYLGKSALRTGPTGRCADSLEGHALQFAESGELIWIELFSPRRWLRETGCVRVTDEDGTVIGDADVAEIVRRRKSILAHLDE